jgi:small nuclear ribonucleoprotein (snRNP)-like protein
VRLKNGSSVRIVLVDGTTVVGTVRFSWRWRVIKLTDVVSQTRDGEIVADGYLLIPERSVLFAQVGGA